MPVWRILDSDNVRHNDFTHSLSFPLLQPTPGCAGGAYHYLVTCLETGTTSGFCSGAGFCHRDIFLVSEGWLASFLQPGVHYRFTGYLVLLCSARSWLSTSVCGFAIFNL